MNNNRNIPPGPGIYPLQNNVLNNYYLPIQQHNPAHQQHVPVTQQRIAIPQQHAPIPQQHAPIPQQYAPIPQQYAPIPQQYAPQQYAPQQYYTTLQQYSPQNYPQCYPLQPTPQYALSQFNSTRNSPYYVNYQPPVIYSQTNGPSNIRQKIQIMINSPVQCICPACQNSVLTIISRRPGIVAWVICLLLCVFCFPFCIYPLLCDPCLDVYHICPNCNNIISVKSPHEDRNN